MRRLPLASALALVGLLLWNAPASAGGLEYTGNSAQSLGRGGAVTARADSPMVLADNPAGLVELRGSQFLFDLNLPLFDACVEPIGYYGWGVYGGGRPARLFDDKGNVLELQLGNAELAMTEGTPENRFYSDPYDTVCFDQAVTPVPQIAWTRRLNEDIGIGFGLIFPAIHPAGRWGGTGGVIHGDDGLRLAATRYMLLSSNNLGIFPNLGIAYKLTHEIRLGISLEWGIIAVNNTTMVAEGGGTRPTQDIIAHVKAQDWFVPALTASVHLVPIDALDVVLAFRFQDELNAEGDIDLTTGRYDPMRRENTTSGLPITSLTQGMPWKLTGGIRYADRLLPRLSGTGRNEGDPAHLGEVIHDPLQDELWDIELDVEYQMNSKNDAQRLEYAPGRQVLFVPLDPNTPPGMVPFPNPADPVTVIEKAWQDQLVVRLGSTVNLLPGVLGVSGGAHYETRGVNPDYMQVDFWPVQRFGLHTGITVRVARSIDFRLSYAHIFQEDIVVGAPEQLASATAYSCAFQPESTTEPCPYPPGQVRTIDRTVGASSGRGGGGREPIYEQPPGDTDGTARLDQNLSNMGPPDAPWIVNAGRYTSSYNIIAAGVQIHF